ncbi:hypothetical protein ACH5RR_040297 [Cinchona calisaya]|uniref:FAD-binding domain-containing protein n=1 Tax=Cinchona calisaya TaxID=153742 RepID=A0ABD2XUH3_9GENT
MNWRVLLMDLHWISMNGYIKWDLEKQKKSAWTIRKKPICLSIVKAKADVKKEDIVIVGAGIAGLGTAVSLQWLGIGSKVLEQAESLRIGGTSLALFKNGWSVLDAIGVGSQLRKQFLEMQGQEVRAVERRILLETLANKATTRCHFFLLKAGKHPHKGKWKNFIGTSRWYSVICSGFFPDGQPFEPKVNYIYGKGIRAGYVPVSSTKVYWFVCFNSSSPGPKITDPSVLRQQTKELVRNWPSDLLNIIDLTPDDTIIRTPLVDRWLWPVVSPSASTGKVVLVGDAWHPMTPNLGPGACCALEDAIVLSKKLADALQYKTMSVENAFTSYEEECWGRVFPLTIRANAVGKLLQWDNPLVCSVRNNIVIPKLAWLGPVLDYTNFKFELLLTN